MDVMEKLPSKKRLIDANALIKEACADGAYGYVDAKQIVDAPTVDAVEVVHGRWVDNGACGYKWAFYCSKCGYIDGYPFNDRHNYCPNCGAKMDEGIN